MEDRKKEKQEEIEKLVSASQKGDAEAFGKLYDIFVQPIYRYVYYRVGAADAEDLTELVFLKTWENIEQYSKENLFKFWSKRNRSFAAWIFRIAHNVVVDHYRANRPSEELKEDIEDHRKETSATMKIHNHFDHLLLSEAMKELKDHYRQVIILKYINDLSNEEISIITGRSEAALRILQFRALKSLRHILERKGIFEFDV